MISRSVRSILGGSAVVSAIVVASLASGAAVAGERVRHESRPSGTPSELAQELPDTGPINAFALTGEPGVGSVTLTWDDPNATFSPQTYLVRVSDAGIAPIATRSQSATLPGLTPGLAYTFTVERQDGTHATSQVVVVPNSPAVHTQVNSVTRPEGSLVMRVSRQLSLGSVLPATVYVDPTGSGSIVSAWGRLNQITVIDTRNDDIGWALTGSVTAVFASDGRRWNGDYLGWTPIVTRDSARVPTGPETFYDQTVAVGAVVPPGTGLVSGDGLASGPANVLASARPGAGLGEAVIDGRFLLMLPAAATAASYSTVLTLSLI
jgi:hypothetical protein